MASEDTVKGQANNFPRKGIFLVENERVLDDARRPSSLLFWHLNPKDVYSDFMSYYEVHGSIIFIIASSFLTFKWINGLTLVNKSLFLLKITRVN